MAKRAIRQRSPVRFTARMLPGAKPAPAPGFLAPALATLRRQVPANGWIYEIKFDGYRVQAHLAGGKAVLFTRTGLDWTARFAPVAAAIQQLPANTLVLDGEIIVPDANGISRFEQLQADLATGRRNRLHFYAFDVLHLDGFDLRQAPLVGRKAILSKLVADDRSGRIHFSTHTDSDGAAVFQAACSSGLEGIIAKRADAPYRSGRTDSWVKIKCVKRETLPIVGFMPSGATIASLLLGRRQGDGLVYAGRAGTGFTSRSAAELRQLLEPLAVTAQPLVQPVRLPKAVWVRPELRADVEYHDVTEAGLLRAGVFKRLAK